MADSENEPKPLPASLPEGVTSLVVTNQYGHIRETQKDTKTGRFLAKKRPLIPTVEFVRARRKRLMRVREDNNMTEDQSILNELLEIINTPVAVDAKSGLPDAKHMMAKIKAAEVVWLYTGGKPDPSERELDKLERQPIEAYFITTPSSVNPVPVDGDKPVEKPKQPTFAEIIGIKTNPKA